ncbi:MAG: TetR family transcriptional regulator [Sphingopyxis sp.]|nr:TetR family transcriptional regulator [Sphingopyxis sp.]
MDQAQPNGGAENAAARKGAGRRGRPSQHDENVDRRDVILDAAEALFCVHGFHGVTVRQVATEAGVDPALLNYYFTSKLGLFDSVFLRRAEVVNTRRLESMERYKGSTAAMTVEGSLQSFFEPVLDLWELGGDGWKNYLRLVALVNNTPIWGGQTMTQFFDPVIQTLIELLRDVLPEAHDEDLYWCYHFTSGALSLSFADTGRIDNLSGGLCRSGDVAAVRKRLAYFLASGTTDLCRRLAQAKG